MKRFLALALTILLVLSLAACGEEKRTSKKDNTAATQAQTEPTNAIIGDPERPTLAPSTPATNSDEISFGDYSSTHYENEYFGFGVQVPSDWTSDNTASLASQCGTTEDKLLNDFENQLKDSQTTYTFKSIDNTTGNNVNVIIENLAKTNNSGLGGKEYLELVESQLSSYYESIGATDVEMEITTWDFNGVDFDTIEISCMLGDIELQQLQLVAPAGDYMAVITFTVTDMDKFGYIDDYFYAV